MEKKYYELKPQISKEEALKSFIMTIEQTGASDSSFLNLLKNYDENAIKIKWYLNVEIINVATHIVWDSTFTSVYTKDYTVKVTIDRDVDVDVTPNRELVYTKRSHDIFFNEWNDRPILT